MKLRLPRAVPLLAISVTLVLPDFGSVAATGIENPTCELVSPGVYRLDFQASPEAGPVEVFASSRPDRIDSPRPLLTIRKAPAVVSSSGRPGRVYFLPKPPSGATRGGSNCRLLLIGTKNLAHFVGFTRS